MKKETWIVTMSITVVIIMITGITYSVFAYTGRGENLNNVSTTTVAMSYTEGKNGIDLVDAMPISDDAGKALTTESTQAFDFTVTITTTPITKVKYEVSLEKETVTNMIPDSDIRIYLTKKEENDNNYSPVGAIQTFTKLGTASEVGTKADEMLIDSGTVDTKKTYQYILRMWVGDTYEIGETEKEYKVRVNVYGKET